jgi:hypothetical protein
MKAAFWRYAHKRYHSKSMSILTELAFFTWSLFFVIVYGAALLAGWQPSVLEAILGAALIGAPTAVGFAHRLIRLEALKGPGALYRKRLATSR